MDNQETLRFYDSQARHYHKIRARPVQVYTDASERAALLPLVSEASDILDLGCGEGRLSSWMAREKQKQGGPFEVWGVDFSPEMVRYARQFAADLPVKFAVGDAMGLEFADNSFDLVVSCTSPNNFPSLDGALSEIHRVLRPGGLFFAVIINSRELARFARYVYLAPYFIREFFRKLRRDDGYIRVLYSRDELERLLAGRFEILELAGMRVLPDFVPVVPFNIWPPLFPATRAVLKAGENLDRKMERSAFFGPRARFHRVVARVVK